MARIIYCHPSRTNYEYHLYTDLDFWDARRILNDLAVIKRHYGEDPSGEEFPTQVVRNGLNSAIRDQIEHRLMKAIVSPPRHMIMEAIIRDGFYEFDPLKFFPDRWSKDRMMYFTYLRLPLDQSALNSPYREPKLSWVDGKIRVERVQRKEKYDPVLEDRKEARRRLTVPSCF
jgi:hypothetical protein